MRRSESQIAKGEKTSRAESWALRLKQGEADAVREVRNRVSRILAYGRLEIPSQDRADLEQETMTEIWQAVHRSSFDFSRGFWGFVELVTSRRCIDWIRSRRETLGLDEKLLSDQRGPLQYMVEQERAALAQEILTELPPQCAKLILLRLRDDLPYAEIASLLSENESALRTRFHRCVGYARRVAMRLARSWNRFDGGGQGVHRS